MGPYGRRAVHALLLSCFHSGMDAARFEYANILERSEQVKEAYDYVIVGGGTSGLTVADRLTESGKYTVLVVEHGALDNGTDIARAGAMGGGDRLYNITSVPQIFMDNRTQAVNIGKLVGGSSAINGMAFMRGTSAEYDGWAELGGPNSTWNWQGVLTYFKKAAYFTPPSEQLAKAYNISWDMNAWGQDPSTHIYASFSPNQDPGLIPVFNVVAKLPGVERPKDGAAGTHGLFWIPSSIDPITYDRSYARIGHFDNLSRPNYELIADHKVNKLLFNGSTAIGVQFTATGGDSAPIVVKANKEVILAAGAIHTPQVLQLSGIGEKGLLEKAKIPLVVDLPGVGQKFQDQGWIGNIAFKWTNGTGPPHPHVNVTRAPGTGPAYNVVARLGLPAVTDRLPALVDHLASQADDASLPAGAHPDVVRGYGAFRQLHLAQMRRRNVSWLGFLVNPGPGGNVMNMHTLSHGSVSVDVVDPWGSEPVVDYRALSNPVDTALMIEYIRWLRRLMAHPDFAPWGPLETSPGPEVTSDEDLAAWVRKVYNPSLYHPVGTAAKMPRELGGVVGETLLVHGTKGLSVVDASIMPTLPGGPTSQTVYMIAEKAADLIKARQ